MIIIIAEEGKKIHLGRVGENEARAVRFDISRIQAEFPGATFSVLNMRPEDPDAYPVNGQYIRIEGNYLYWTLQSGDLTQDALGECELKATLDGVIVKSIIWTTEICPALDGNGTPPEPWESWQQQVEDDADRAEGAAEDSEAWAVGERGGVPVVEGDETYHNNAKYWADQAEETLASKADKRDTVLETTLSRGRKSGTTVGNNSFAFGENVTASAQNSHAEGKNTTASGIGAHAEGYKTTADQQYTHAEGNETTASAPQSHSEGLLTVASGWMSHAEGNRTIANHLSQHVFGEYNASDPSTVASSLRGNFVEIVGNGTGANNRKNARTLDWNGNERLKGKLFVNANADGTGGDEVLTEHQDVSGKADKVQGAVSGNFAGLDAEGNLTDSGSKASDFLTEHQDISGKADKVSGGTADNLAALDASGNLKDSGKAASDFVAAEDFRADAMPMSATDPTTVAQTATELKSQIQQKAAIITDTVQNVAIASVSDATAHPVKSLIVGIEPKQSGTGDPSPSNVRPITGWDAVVLSQSGADTSDPETHTADLPSTVFGGQIDWVGAECADELTLFEFDGSDDEAWASNGSNGYYLTVGDDYKTEQTPIANYLKGLINGNSSGLSAWQCRMNGVVSLQTNFMVKPDMATYDTLAKWKTYLSNNPLHVLLKKAVATEIPLSDLDEISTVEGVNNLWADCGDVLELTYGCDTKGYIDKKMAELTALILENS